VGHKGVFVKHSIVLTGGGTAGHVWPHFALFDDQNSPLYTELNNGNLTVHYFGSHTGLEHELVKSVMPTWHYHSIATGKLRRYFSIRNFFDPLRVLLGCWQAFWLLRKIKPFVVFSKGGFVAAPVVWAAWLNQIPVVIHESDATPALATKLTLPFCQKILCAFSETIKDLPKKAQEKALEVGLPLRSSLFSASREDGQKFFNFKNSKFVVLIFGGSLGAKGLNTNIEAVLPKLCDLYNVIHITGKGNKNSFSHPDYRQFEFLKTEMKFAYATSDVAICRAGASSIFELARANIPMILIPLGLHASRGDQIINAKIFVQKGWAQAFEETQFKGDVIIKTIQDTFTSLSVSRSALNTVHNHDASNTVAKILYEYSTLNAPTENAI
jgi:UDP-N-acetylglucosamine--N-acetylmuramyl-(pentapeptide) pyrophosphoryl-undecaprenol N-acetylglucosamine transferase